MITLDPLRAIITELERVVEDVASKVENAVVSDVSQTAVDELVGRVGGAIGKLTGITAAPAAPAAPSPTETQAAGPVWTPPMSAGVEPAAPAAPASTPTAPAAAAPAWTPEHPAA